MDATGQSTVEAGNRAKDAAAHPPRYQPLVVVALAAAAGVVLDRYGQSPWGCAAVHGFAAWWVLAVCCLVLWWLFWRRNRHRQSTWLLVFSIALAAAAWHHLNWQLFSVDEVARCASSESSPACIDAVARESPERVPAPRETPLRAIPAVERTRFTINVVAIRDGTTWRPASGICRLTVNGHVLGVHSNDRLRIFGQLLRPSPPLNQGEFDFAANARADRELTRIQSSAPDCVAVLRHSEQWSLHSALETLRRHCRQLVLRYVGPEHAGVAAAMLLGARDGLPREETNPYFLTGTIHVLVVSGMNVAILTAGFLFLMRFGWLSRRAGLVTIAVAACAYAVLTEAQPPVVRAAVVATLMCVAAWRGRPGAAFNSLAAAALFALVLNPTDLFRVGPQLSFLAVATLIWIGNWSWLKRPQPADRLEQLLAASRPWYARFVSRSARWLLVSLAIAGIVWLTAAPLVLHRFNVVTPVAVLISPAVSLLVLVALWSGFLMLIVGGLAPPVAYFFGAICARSLAGLEAVVQGGESLPCGHFWMPGPEWWWVIGFYLGLVFVMISGHRLIAPRWQAALLSAWILVGLTPPLARAMSRDEFRCSFVAVGHGTCVVMQAPGGETLLYDAGSLGSPEYSMKSIAAYLWYRGILRIDGLVLSHADVDHYNAVPDLLERFHIGSIYVSPLMFDSFGESAISDGPTVLRAAIERAGVPIREIWAGDRLQMGPDVTINVLHPPRQGVLGSDNANSITLAIEHDGRRILLPGDLESPGIEDLMAELPYDCDVLLAPHHGSRRSDPPGFAAWSTPDWVVISGGNGDDLRPVVLTYEAAGAQVLLTYQTGTVEFATPPPRPVTRQLFQVSTEYNAR
ncbi:MAG: ComEC/Rec2 family competence protein [Planctomycetes bacterium]|nr:ComEC/Rec2 family competence protein [Planctomycetota bacterium]